MPNLEGLFCCDTQLTSLPDMPNLMSLYCSNTHITNLSNIPNLRFLMCSNTQLTSLPDMPNLIELYCNGTQITSLPYVPKLEILSCDIMDMNVYKKQLKIIKNMIILSSLQMITSKSVLSAININGFNISRLVRDFLI
jgi:Leucine-rich repeat (LRR) protein